MGGRLPIAVLLLLAVAAPSLAEEAGCLLCHLFPMRTAAGGSLRLASDRGQTGHAKVSCRSCHSWVTMIPHGAPSPPAACGGCHAATARDLSASVHGEGRKGEVGCRGCHREESDRGTSAPVGAMVRCLPCHAQGERWAGYLRSPHGRQLGAGRPPAALCPDCHTVHAVLPPSDPGSSIAPARIADTCRGSAAPGKECHGSAGDAFAGIPAGHSSPDEATAALFPRARILLAASAALMVLLAAVCLIPAGDGRR